MIIYTDGSCLGNPGPGGWSYVVTKEGILVANESGLKKYATNNNMEATAVLNAIRYIKAKKNKEKVKIITDSRYCLNTIKKISNFSKKDFTHGHAKDMPNVEVWKEVSSELSDGKYDIEFEWVKGHANSKWNNLADKLAKNAANEAKKILETTENNDLEDLIRTEELLIENTENINENWIKPDSELVEKHMEEWGSSTQEISQIEEMLVIDRTKETQEIETKKPSRKEHKLNNTFIKYGTVVTAFIEGLCLEGIVCGQNGNTLAIELNQLHPNILYPVIIVQMEDVNIK